MLLRDVVEKPCFDAPSGFSGARGGESPARAATALIFDRTYHVSLTPVNFKDSFGKGCENSGCCLLGAACCRVANRANWIGTPEAIEGILRIYRARALAFGAISSNVLTG